VTAFQAPQPDALLFINRASCARGFSHLLLIENSVRACVGAIPRLAGCGFEGFTSATSQRAMYGARVRIPALKGIVLRFFPVPPRGPSRSGRGGLQLRALILPSPRERGG
jgi:hypothetical protein